MKKIYGLAIGVGLVSTGYIGLITDYMKEYAVGNHTPIISMWTLGVILWLLGILTLYVVMSKKEVEE